MANKSSNHLYKLIKSLTKAEKRYFKLFVTRHTADSSKNNYQILFDAIDKQNEYNEELLLKSLKNHLFINKFSIAKARLYDTILKSLDAYYAEKSINKLIQSEIHFIEILFNKSLYKQCAKRIVSAKKLAVKHDLKVPLKVIIDLEKKLIEKDNYSRIQLSEIEKLIKTEKQTLSAISLEADLWELKSKLFQQINTKGRARNKSEVANLTALISEKLANITIDKREVKLNYLYLHIKSAYNFSIYDYSACFNTLEQTIDLLEKNPIEFKEEPNVLFSELINCVYLAVQLKKTKEAKHYYVTLKNTFKVISENASEDLILKLKSSLLSLELSLVKNSLSLTDGDSILKQTILFVTENKSKINETRLAYLYYNISVVYFLKQSFNEALKWINMLLNNINIDKTQEVYSFAQIFNLIIHLELDNKELINYTISSTKRFLQTRNKMFDFEDVILNFIKKISSQNDVFETSEAYVDLEKKLVGTKNNKYEQIPLEYFDYLSWVESKLNKQPMYKIAKQKALDFNF